MIPTVGWYLLLNTTKCVVYRGLYPVSKNACGMCMTTGRVASSACAQGEANGDGPRTSILSRGSPVGPVRNSRQTVEILSARHPGTARIGTVTDRADKTIGPGGIVVGAGQDR